MAAPRNRKHILVPGPPTAEAYRPHGRKINIPKPEVERRTPDLLYALRLYLTGDNGANAIHIAEVSEG